MAQGVTPGITGGLAAVPAHSWLGKKVMQAEQRLQIYVFNRVDNPGVGNDKYLVRLTVIHQTRIRVHAERHRGHQ